MLEVKGDFCRQVRSILAAANREADYLEIGLDTGVCYNPLHNDLDPYAVAYAIASLLNNLFGKSKEPFWQQAYTDLLKFVISLRRITDGYTTLSEVYRYIIDDGQIDKNIRTLKAQFDNPPDVLVDRRANDYQGQVRQAPWTLWVRLGDTHVAHPYDAELEAYLAEHDDSRSRCGPAPRRSAPTVDTGSRRFSAGSTTRGRRLDQQVKASIVEGIVVFLSLFDENPAVYRAFCPPRAAYITPPKPGEPRPLPPLEDLLETGHVLGLNFPVAMNPALARGLGVMLKLDFQRAVLQRIPKIAANPQASWRDLLFVADEYHAFATVGETDPTGDERAFALSRQARLIPIVATQSMSSLRSALGSDEALAHAAAVLPHQGVPRHERRIHRAHRRGTVRASGPAEGAVHARRRRAGRAHLAAHRPRHGVAAQPQRQQDLHAGIRLHVSAARVHGAAARAGDRAAVRRAQSAAAAVLLPEAALPRRADELLRSRGARGAMSSLDRILPFLQADRGSAPSIPTVTEVMVNDGGRRVFVERDGALEPVPGRTLEPRNLTVAIKNIARACGDEISDMQPILDARLEDGSRVAAMFPPCAVAGPALTIRKFTRRYSLDELVDVGTLTPALAAQLTARRRDAAEHPDLRRHGNRQDDAAQRAGGAHPRRGSHRRDRGDGGDSPRQAEPAALRGAPRASAARPGGAAAAGHDRRPAARDASPSARIASSSARCAAQKRSTCCRRSTPAISAA